MGYEVWGRTKVLSARSALGLPCFARLWVFLITITSYPKAPQVRAHRPHLLRQSNVVCGLFDFRNFGLFLFGFTGSGKTWLAASIVNELTDRGLRCKYTSMLKIVTDLNNLKNESRDHYLSQLWKVDLLVLDDFGMEAENNTSTNILNLIVSNCRELRVPIIVVTPYLEDQLTKDNSSNKRVHALKHLKERCLTVTLPLPGSRCAASYKQKAETEAIIKKGLPAPGKQQPLPFGDR